MRYLLSLHSLTILLDLVNIIKLSNLGLISYRNSLIIKGYIEMKLKMLPYECAPPKTYKLQNVDFDS